MNNSWGVKYFFLRPNNFIIFIKAGFFLIIAIKRVLRFLGANFCVVVYIIFISEFTHNKVWTRILRFNYHISIHDRKLEQTFNSGGNFFSYTFQLNLNKITWLRLYLFFVFLLSLEMTSRDIAWMRLERLEQKSRLPVLKKKSPKLRNVDEVRGI